MLPQAPILCFLCNYPLDRFENRPCKHLEATDCDFYMNSTAASHRRQSSKPAPQQTNSRSSARIN